MPILMDMIFSAVIGGMMLISLHSLNTKLNAAASTKTLTTGVQQNLNVVTDILEYDLRKVGYNNFTLPNFKSAESSKVYLRGDFNNDGNPDSVTYYLGTVADASQINPRSRVLYRAYNGGTPVPIRVGVTRFRFWYYDQAGTPLATTPAVANSTLIRSVKVTLSLQAGSFIEPKRLPNGTVKYDTTFSSASWEKMIRPVNLK